MLTTQQALELQTLAITQAQANNCCIAIAVADTHGELITFAKMDGTALHAAKLAKNKAYTSARDRQTTSSLAAWAQATNKDLSYWSDDKFTGIAGGVPIVVDNMTIGALGVSGLAEQDDEALAISVIDQLFNK